MGSFLLTNVTFMLLLWSGTPFPRAGDQFCFYCECNNFVLSSVQYLCNERDFKVVSLSCEESNTQ